jgi:preprotein translocase subunit Sec61beta
VKRIGSLALVLIGIWVLTQALLLLAYPLNVALYGSGGGVRRLVAVPVSLVPALAVALLGVWLIARRRQLSARWFDDDGPEVRLDGRSLLRAGLVLIGVSAIVAGIMALLNAAMRFVLFVEPPAEFGTEEALRGLAPELAVGAAGIVVGLLLIAVSRPLSRRLWSGGGMPPASLSPAPSRCPSCGAAYDPADNEWGGPYPPTCDACGEALAVVGT